jgi:hypothetical protein
MAESRSYLGSLLLSFPKNGFEFIWGYVPHQVMNVSGSSQHSAYHQEWSLQAHIVSQLVSLWLLLTSHSSSFSVNSGGGERYFIGWNESACWCCTLSSAVTLDIIAVHSPTSNITAHIHGKERQGSPSFFLATLQPWLKGNQYSHFVDSIRFMGKSIICTLLESYLTTSLYCSYSSISIPGQNL